MGDDIGGGLYRGAAARRRGILALGRALGAAMGTPADPAHRFRRVTHSRPAVHGRGRPSHAGGGAAAHGICAAVFGVLVPLTIADITRGTGRFNLAQGIVGSGIGIGASLSTTLAGWMSDRLGSSVAFLGLACIGATGLVLTALLMPETMERKAGAATKRAFSTLDQNM